MTKTLTIRKVKKKIRLKGIWNLIKKKNKFKSNKEYLEIIQKFKDSQNSSRMMMIRILIKLIKYRLMLNDLDQ